MREADLSQLSLSELAALCASGEGAPARALAERLLLDERAGARSLGTRLLRRLDGDASARRAGRARLRLERACWARGITRVAGVDEAGMGPLAGPVVAAAVILDPAEPILEADDSKKLARAERERLEPIIKQRAMAWGLGIATVEDIAREDVLRAGLLAMRRAVLALDPQPEHLLVDARVVPDVPMTQEAHVKGDARSCSIAAASILAKVERDRLMADLAERHPGYGFDKHAGYGTPEHLDAIRRLGPCAAHRMSWRALAQLTLFD